MKDIAPCSLSSDKVTVCIDGVEQKEYHITALRRPCEVYRNFDTELGVVHCVKLMWINRWGGL